MRERRLQSIKAAIRRLVPNVSVPVKNVCLGKINSRQSSAKTILKEYSQTATFL
jgi:hypothetical protein